MNDSDTASMSPHDIVPFDPIVWEPNLEASLKACDFPLLPSNCSSLESLLDSATSNLDPAKPALDVEAHLGNVSRILNASDIDYFVPEPTPICPNRIDVVENVPLAAAPWHQDKSIFSSLYSVLIEKSSETQALSSPGSLSSNLSVGSGQRDSNPGNDESTVDSRENSSLTNDTNYSRRWNERYQDLVEFLQKYGHCLVPLNWPPNPALGHWVKRQRYQYSLKMNGTHSTMTKEREEALERLGFVWDSHAALWEERWNELREFRELHGHCHVPSRYPENPKLSIWVKCQRRQFKLLASGQKSNMTQERIVKLRRLGLALSPRQRKSTEANDFRSMQR